MLLEFPSLVPAGLDLYGSYTELLPHSLDHMRWVFLPALRLRLLFVIELLCPTSVSLHVAQNLMVAERSGNGELMEVGSAP